MSFDQVGGLDHYIKALKEMVFLPLVYPELFERFHLSPPRGVLFYGPPGTMSHHVVLTCRHKQHHGTLQVALSKTHLCLTCSIVSTVEQVPVTVDVGFTRSLLLCLLPASICVMACCAFEMPQAVQEGGHDI